MEPSARGIRHPPVRPFAPGIPGILPTLARSHYENFSLATWFLPKQLRQDFLNVYAYCRISDDLGDEVGDPMTSLALLDEWQGQLDAATKAIRAIQSSSLSPRP